MIINVDKKLVEYIEGLEEENKELKKHHICVKPYTNDELREKIDNYKDTIKQLSKSNIDKQQKIDKATEYIKELQNSCLVFSNIAYKELLKILGDKE